MSKWYFRDGTLATTADLDTDEKLWIEQMGKIEEKLRDPKYKRVAETTLPNGMWVSTVWLGLDHNFFDKGKPMIFETMVFPEHGNFSEIDCQRYSTEKQALKGHQKMVKKYEGIPATGSSA